MAEEDEILAELAEAEPQGLAAVLESRTYTLKLTEPDSEVMGQKGRWEHLEGVLYRRKCHSVGHCPVDGTLHFSIDVGGPNVEDVVQAIAEELDEITGRKMEQANGETWGMF